jgi:hypothetical protein
VLRRDLGAWDARRDINIRGGGECRPLYEAPYRDQLEVTEDPGACIGHLDRSGDGGDALRGPQFSGARQVHVDTREVCECIVGIFPRGHHEERLLCGRESHQGLSRPSGRSSIDGDEL